MSGSGAVHVAFDVKGALIKRWNSDVFEGVQMLRQKINPKDNVCLFFEDGQEALHMAVLLRLRKSIKTQEDDSGRVHEFALTYAIGPVTLKISRCDPFTIWTKRILLGDLNDAVCDALLSEVQQFHRTTIDITCKKLKIAVMHNFHQPTNECCIRLESTGGGEWSL
jgi:hypothetical protein